MSERFFVWCELRLVGDSGIKAEAESEYLHLRRAKSIAQIGSKLVTCKLVYSEHPPYISQLELVDNILRYILGLKVTLLIL